MKPAYRRLAALALFSAAAIPTVVGAADWPIWGDGPTRNMVSQETGIPVSWDPGRFKGNTEEIDPATTKNVKWVAKLGSQSYGNPVVAGGKIFLGTNNETPRNPVVSGDRAVVMCLEEKTGKFLWQLAAPKLGTGRVNDWEFLGICASPTVDGDRVYVTTNRAEVVCMDVNGMANGNDGPFKDEGQYNAGPGKPPLAVGPTDADIIWRFDMREELGVFPHNANASSVLIVGNKLITATANGVDNGHTTMPAPRAPALCMLDKRTGQLLGEETSGISAGTLHSNWSSAGWGKVGSQEMIIFGGGNGICYAYDMNPVKAEDGFNVLKELWRYDCNPPEYRVKNGKPLKYAAPDGTGPSEVLAMPVFYKNRVYVPIGQDPEHGDRLGNLVCIDASKTGDISRTGAVWSFKKIGGTMATVAVADDLVYANDFTGRTYCLDANTGTEYWMNDAKSRMWSSPLVVDGKLYFGTEDGDIIILKAGKTKQEVGRVDMRSSVYATPVVANGTLYVMTQTHLFAIGK